MKREKTYSYVRLSVMCAYGCCDALHCPACVPFISWYKMYLQSKQPSKLATWPGIELTTFYVLRAALRHLSALVWGASVLLHNALHRCPLGRLPAQAVACAAGGKYQPLLHLTNTQIRNEMR